MTADIIEAEVRELPPERAVQTVPDQGIADAGTFALAAMTDEDFDQRLGAMVKHRERVQMIQRALMKKDVHYGIIPGTPKPTLLQPGAELLCDIYRLRANFTPLRVIGDGVTEPHLAYLTRCDLHLGALDGPIVASATGAANSWERKYRYRTAERACPTCGVAGTILKSKQGKAEWFCWAKRGGCGATFAIGDPAITEQALGQIDNPDPFDLDVTLDAMAAKRAFVHATRRGCAVSDLFTSDIEDAPGAPETPQETRTTAPAPQSADGYGGTAEVGKAPSDFELRQGPSGHVLSFRLVDGRKGIKVVAQDPLASALAAVRPSVVGQPVTCWGPVTAEGFDKTQPDGTVRKITYNVLHLERIQTPDLTLPSGESFDAAGAVVSPSGPPPEIPALTPAQQSELDAL